MNKALLLLGFLYASLSIDVYAENITIEENLIWGNTYLVDGKKMQSWFIREELRKVMHDNPESVKILDDSIVYGMSSTLMMVSGVIMIGEQVADLLAGNDPSITIAFAGAGFIKLGSWLREKKQAKYKEAIDVFNSGQGAGADVESDRDNPVTPNSSDLPNKSSQNKFDVDVGPGLIRLSLSFN